MLSVRGILSDNVSQSWPLTSIANLGPQSPLFSSQRENLNMIFRSFPILSLKPDAFSMSSIKFRAVWIRADDQGHCV
jgi:hypothetical protein